MGSLRLVGITQPEFDALIVDEGEGVSALLDARRKENPMLITDPRRTQLCATAEGGVV